MCRFKVRVPSNPWEGNEMAVPKKMEKKFYFKLKVKVKDLKKCFLIKN